MKKKLFNGLVASLILLLTVQPLASPFISPNGLVFANNITKSETSSSQKSPNLTALSNKNKQIDSKKEKNLKKVLTQPLMSLGSSLSSSEKADTKRLLGDTNIAEDQVIDVDGKTIAKYLDDVDTNSKVYSSAYIKPLSEGSGVQVEIVTPTKITKVSSTTYQNAAITSGVSDVLIRIASVNEVSGEGALAGVYALLDKVGFSVDKKTIKTSQDEIGLIDKIKEESHLSDDDANKFLAELKKQIIKKVTDKEKIDDSWLQDILKKACDGYGITLSDGLKSDIITWLKEFSYTDTAKSKQSVNQLDQSLLTSDWSEVLSKLDKVLSRDEILALDKQDYSEKNGYHEIIAALYNKLLKAIQDKDLKQVKLIYTNSFAVEHLLGSPSTKEKEALNYIRMLCYYFIASTEDSKLGDALQSDDKPAWLVSDNTKDNLLASLKRYQNVGQNPSLQELLIRIAIATGYSYEAFLYKDIRQEGHVIKLTIVCPYLKNDCQLYVVYNLKTGVCLLKDGKDSTRTKLYDFKKAYGVDLEDKHQPLVDDLENFKLSQRDSNIFKGTNINETAHSAYKEIVKDYVLKVNDPNYQQGSGVDYDPVMVLKNYNNNKVNYLVTDLNDDGVDELLIGSQDNSIYVVYTFDGKKAVNLFNNKIPFGLRPGLTIFKDGTLQVHWGSSAYISSEMTYRINYSRTGLDKLLDYTVYSPSESTNVSEVTYSVDGHSYNEDEFWSKYEAFKPYVIQESDGDTEPAEKADFQLIEAPLKETTPSSDK